MNNNLNSINKKISIKIRLERTKRNLSQEGLASIAGISRITIGKIERSEVSPTIDTLEKLANALQIDFQNLIDVSKVSL